MSRRPQQTALMRRLGFTVKDHGYGPQYDSTHWEHKPSGGVVVLGPTQLPSAAAIVRWVIASALNRHLLQLEQTISRPIGTMRREVCDVAAKEMEAFHYRS